MNVQIYSTVSAIKVLFWNIGDKLSDSKITVLKQAIKRHQPDVLTIAEGTPSRKACHTLVGNIEGEGYKTYYSPLHADQKEFELEFGYFDLGLKIFVKDVAGRSYDTFNFELLRRKGRILVLRFYWDFKAANLLFIHNKAIDAKETTIHKQGKFLDDLAQLVNKSIKPAVAASAGATTEGRVFILGDFNMQPWASLLRFEEGLMTSFFENRNLKDRLDEGLFFFNPLVKLIQSTAHKNLLGTYYTDTNGWALLDYALYPTENSKVYFDVLTDLGDGTILLNPDETLRKGFLNYGFDHLPILATIE